MFPKNQNKKMTNQINKYTHQEMDKNAGIEHTSHRTKIVATVGPACDSYDQLLDLVKAGVNVFRLNFSHGTHEDKALIIDHIRKINSEEPYNISILGDLQGPKLRVGEIENNALDLKEGDILTFTNEKCVGTLEKNQGCVAWSYKSTDAVGQPQRLEVGFPLLCDR